MKIWSTIGTEIRTCLLFRSGFYYSSRPEASSEDVKGCECNGNDKVCTMDVDLARAVIEERAFRSSIPLDVMSKIYKRRTASEV